MRPLENPADGELTLRALRYAAGELAGAEAEAFERTLAADAAAREILGETVRLSAAVSGVAVPAPRVGALNAIRDRLFPTALRRLFPTKSYRGHPVVWAGLGSLAAGLLALAIDLAADPAPQFVARPPIRPLVPKVVEVPVPPAPELPSPASPMAGMDPVPMAAPMPRVETVPTAKPVETKKG